MTIIDISVPISNSMPIYKGDPPVKIERTSDVNKGDALTLSHMDMGAHTGTHLDAPYHFIRGGKTVEQLDLRVLIGPARVLDMQHVERAISPADLKAANLPGGTERILFKTRNSSLWAKPGFQEDFVAFDADGAQWLVDHGVRLVAIDYLSAELFGTGNADAHHILLGAGVIIVEGVILKDVMPGEYRLICLPIKLEGAEGAPARVVLLQD